MAVRAGKSRGLQSSRPRCAIEQDSGGAGQAFSGVGLDLLSYWAGTQQEIPLSRRRRAGAS